MATLKDLSGTYGLTGNDGVDDNITLVIKKNSYCAGTRDDDVIVTTNKSEATLKDSIVYKFECAPNTTIDGVVSVPGLNPVKFTTFSSFDGATGTSFALLDVRTGAVAGNIEMRIATVNNYPLIQTVAPVPVIDFDPSVPAEPSIYVYVDKYTETVGTNITGSIILTNLVVDQLYHVNITDIFTSSAVTGFPDIFNNDITATAETMSIPFSVASTNFTSTEVWLNIEIISLITPEPPPPV